MRRGLVVFLTFAFGQGCASSYEPAKSPRIATVIEGGQPTFVKDGVHFGSPVWGTGLLDAVHGNPQAEHHARVGRNLIAGGFVLGFVGLGAEIGALAVLVHEDNQQNSAPPSGLALGLLVGGVAAALTGSALIMAGQPHVYDAVNIHNDSVDVRPPTAQLGPRAQYAH
jgi:hypothetical protein